MGPVEAWLRIIRPPIVIISIFGAAVGALNATEAQGLEFQGFSLLLTLLGAGLLGAGLMVHNDFTDLESDRVNRPHKPIPSGAISPETARIVGLVMMLAAIPVAMLTSIMGIPGGDDLTPVGLNIPCGLLTVIIVLIGIRYNIQGKYKGIWGHTAVAFGVGAIPYWGAVALNPNDLLLMFPLAFAIFVMEIGREIMVCAGDIRGDIEAGFRTTPVRLGRLPSMKVALLFYLASIPIFLIPRFGWFGFPEIFGDLYLAGSAAFIMILLLTWLDSYLIATQGDDDRTWKAFERDIRSGTRLGVGFLQVILLLEVFY